MSRPRCPVCKSTKINANFDDSPYGDYKLYVYCEEKDCEQTFKWTTNLHFTEFIAQFYGE